MQRGVIHVIHDLQREARFQASYGTVMTANLLHEAIYWLRKYKEIEDGKKTDNG